MRYIFIFNGRPDKAFVIEEVNRQLKEAGMDAMACALAQIYSSNGEKDPYNKGIRSAFLFHRFHKVDIAIDGKPLPFRCIQN